MRGLMMLVVLVVLPLAVGTFAPNQGDDVARLEAGDGPGSDEPSA